MGSSLRCRHIAFPILSCGLGVTVFEFIPAIDVLAGRCVQLAQGDYDRATVFDDDPAAVAARFAAHSIQRLHVVDLDGAKDGRRRNEKTIRRIVEQAGSVPVELGGGLRTLESIEEVLAAGVDRAILGTVALRDPELVRDAARRFPGRIAVGIDAKAGRVAVEGWLALVGVRQVVRHRVLVPAFVGSIPTPPAKPSRGRRPPGRRPSLFAGRGSGAAAPRTYRLRCSCRNTCQLGDRYSIRNGWTFKFGIGRCSTKTGRKRKY